MSMGRPSRGQLAQVACLLEVTARKPGNVHRFADFDDTTYLDFLLSAAAIAGPLDRAEALGVGPAVREAVEATRALVATNTNLGMILLFAPLAAVPETTRSLPAGVARVLDATTVEDAREVYRAIRLAKPGGLGVAAEQDVAGEPTVTLVEAMRLAEGRDSIARQYTTGYRDVFEIVLPALRAGLRSGPLEPAIVGAHLATMARLPDTLIARKLGPTAAAESARRAAEALVGGPGPGPEALAALDAWLRAEGHARNPGATADLVAAALFAALRDGTIPLPRPAGPPGWAGTPA